MNCWMSGHLVSVEGRRQTAVTHLALARSLNCRNRHFGFLQKRKNEDTEDFLKIQKKCKARKIRGAADYGSSFLCVKINDRENFKTQN